MDEQELLEPTISDDVGRFAESYASFNKVVRRLQRQYLTLKDTYTQQSEELQSVNRTLQSLIVENRAVSEFLNSILNSLSSGVIAVNKSGMVTHINPAARMILDIPDDKQCRFGITYDDLLCPLSGEEYTALTTVKTGRLFDRVEKRVKTSEGKRLVLSVSTSLLRISDGSIVGAVELFHDITKITRMEEQLSRMKVLASLGEMAASIAHEVRNPLVAVSGFANLLCRDCAEDRAKADMAKKIVDGVESINKTIQTLLDFARHEKLRKSRVNLNDYLTMACDNFVKERELEGLDNALSFDFDEREIEVEIDRQLFRQAILNILNNAIEAGREAPEIVVRTLLLEAGEAEQLVGDRLELAGDEAAAVIEIEDNGSGIPEEDLGRIFSPFYSSKENGNGLGLAISWKIIKAHCGDISVTSRKDQGSRFNIVIPARSGAGRGTRL